MPVTRKPFVIINPTSGGGLARRLWPRVSKTLRKKIGLFESEESTAIGHARLLAAQATTLNFSPIIAFGGDGTIHEVVNGIFDASPNGSEKPVLGILSTGTGGDLIKTLQIPKDIGEQIQIVAGIKTHRIDLGQVEYQNREGKRESRLFVNITDAGLGAEVVRRVGRSRNFFGRRLAYLTSTLESYLAWKPVPVSIKTDKSNGKKWPEKPLAVVIANGRFFGGGMPIAPEADPSDGLFDLVVVGEMCPIKIPLFIPFLYSKKLHRLDNVKVDRVRSVTLTSKHRVGLDIDGEPIGILPATFKILPQALEVKVP